MNARPHSIAKALAWLALAAGIALPLEAQAQTPIWKRGPQYPGLPIAQRGVDGVVWAMANWDLDGAGYRKPKLVVAGGFAVAGGVTGYNNIAMWDGARWRVLGSGFNGIVYALKVHNGELYAGGNFTASGATTCNRIARYDQAAGVWVPVGAGFNSTVEDIESINGFLIAGGNFSSSGATPVSNIARLVGGSWQQMPGGGTNGIVRDMQVLGNKLYVGGTFTTAGSVTGVRNLASWNSSLIWEECNGGTNGAVYSLGTNGSNLLVGGQFTTVKNGEISSNRFGEFVPGTTIGLWISGRGIPGTGGTVMAVTGPELSGSELWAGLNDPTGTVLYRYTGGSWTLAGTTGSANPAITCFERYEGDLHAGGFFNFLNGGLTENSLARFHDENWSPLFPRLNGAVNAFTNSGALIVGGEFEQYLPNGDAAAGMMGWSGSDFAGYGHVRGPVNALSITTNGVTLGRINVGGDFDSAGNASGVNNVASWSGAIGPGGPEANFSALGSGLTDAGDPATAVHAFGAFGSTGGPLGTPILYAGGNFLLSGAVNCRNVARFVSGAWQGLTTGVSSADSNERVNAFANFGGKITIGGAFDIAGGLPANSIAQWNGTAWNTLGNGLRDGPTKGTVNAMVAFGTELFVGGSFDLAGLTASNNIAAWDGTTWLNRSAGLTAADDVRAMANYGGELYAATNRTISGGTEGRVFRWNGSAWVQVGNTADGEIRALFPYRNKLHVGGAFLHASGIESRYWAIIDKYCPADLDNGQGFGTSDGAVDINDLLFFLVRFEAGHPFADLVDNTGFPTPDGAVDINDLLYFLARFEAGC